MNNHDPYPDLNLIPTALKQFIVQIITILLLEIATLSDMDGVLTRRPYKYAVPVLDPDIIGPHAHLAQQQLQHFAVVSARDIEAQLAVPDMPAGIYHFGGLGTRYWDPQRQLAIYTGNPAAQALCDLIIRRLVSRLITAGRGRYKDVYWDYRGDGVNLLLEELSVKRQREVVQICTEIAKELGLNGDTPISFKYRLGAKEPNCDFLSHRMLQIGKGSSVVDFLKVFPRVGFLLLQEDTKQWLDTFVAAAQAEVERQDSNLQGYCSVLVTPSAQEFNSEQIGPNAWALTFNDQGVLARFVAQWSTLLHRAAGK